MIFRHTFTVGYNTAMKRNEIVPFAASWMDLKIIIVSRSKTGKTKYIILLICGILNSDTNELIYKAQTDSQT